MSSPASPSPVARLGWDITKENVGLSSQGLVCGKLAPYTGDAAVPAGTTIRERLITTTLDLSAGDITIERSCVQPTRVGRGMPIITTTDLNTLEPARGPVEIRDSEIDGSRLTTEIAAMATAFSGIGDLSGNYIHDVGTGISMIGTGHKGNALVEGNYVTRLLAWGDSATDGNHSDGFTIRDFDIASDRTRQAIVRNNRFDCDSGNATGAVFIQTYAGPIGNVRLEGNLLEGGGYQLSLNQTNHRYSNMSAVNNRFSGTGWGPSAVQGGPGWQTWRDNHLLDLSAPGARGKSVVAA